MTHSLKEVIDTLRQIAVEMPDEQTQCFYSKEGYTQEIQNYYSHRDFTCERAENPLCIIGHLVHRLDGVEGLRKLSENLGVIDQPETFKELGYTAEALRYMSSVQSYHDDGDTFEGAVAEGTAGA